MHGFLGLEVFLILFVLLWDCVLILSVGRFLELKN